MQAQSVVRRMGAKLAPIVLGLCGLTIWTPWAAAELVDNLPINYSLEAGDSPQEIDGPTVLWRMTSLLPRSAFFKPLIKMRPPWTFSPTAGERTNRF